MVTRISWEWTCIVAEDPDREEPLLYTSATALGLSELLDEDRNGVINEIGVAKGLCNFLQSDDCGSDWQIVDCESSSTLMYRLSSSAWIVSKWEFYKGAKPQRIAWDARLLKTDDYMLKYLRSLACWLTLTFGGLSALEDSKTMLFAARKLRDFSTATVSRLLYSPFSPLTLLATPQREPSPYQVLAFQPSAHGTVLSSRELSGERAAFFLQSLKLSALCGEDLSVIEKLHDDCGRTCYLRAKYVAACDLWVCLLGATVVDVAKSFGTVLGNRLQAALLNVSLVTDRLLGAPNLELVHIWLSPTNPSHLKLYKNFTVASDAPQSDCAKVIESQEALESLLVNFVTKFKETELFQNFVESTEFSLSASIDAEATVRSVSIFSSITKTHARETRGAMLFIRKTDAGVHFAVYRVSPFVAKSTKMVACEVLESLFESNVSVISTADLYI